MLFYNIYFFIQKNMMLSLFITLAQFLIAFHPIIYSLFNKSKKILWDLDIWPETLQAVGLVKSSYIISTLEITVNGYTQNMIQFLLVLNLFVTL